MKIDTIDTSYITAAEIDLVAPITELVEGQSRLVFMVESYELVPTSEADGVGVALVGQWIDRKVRWDEEKLQFVCSCGENCKHILWTIAFIRENRLADYLDTMEITAEVTDRRERPEGTVYTVQDSLNPLPHVVTHSNEGYYDCNCPIARSFEKVGEASCIHEQTARQFEEQFHAELLDYHASVINPIIEQIEQAASELAEK